MARDIFKTACHPSLSIAKLILSTPFLPISLRLNIIFSFHLQQFLPSDIMPLESNVPCTQKISFCICTQFLSLCSEGNTLVSILSKLILVHIVKHISGRYILILGFSVFNVSHPDLFFNSYKVQISVNGTNLLFLKLHSRQHVSAAQSHHQAFLMNRSKINIYSAFGIPSVYIYGTVSTIVLWLDMGIYIQRRMCLQVKNRVYL